MLYKCSIPLLAAQAGVLLLSLSPGLASANPTAAVVSPAERCIVHLHGKGGAGAPRSVQHGKTALFPSGNAAGWNGRMWLYFTQAEYTQARDAVAREIDAAACIQVLLAGFSNGAAFAAKLYCQGETFGGRLAALVLDDPVPDAATQRCKPARALPVTLYWTGALESTAKPGWDCKKGDWTCEGGKTLGIQAFAAPLGVPVKPSPQRQHLPHQQAPEFMAF